MQQALRPYATAGVALVGVGLIAMIPMAPRLPDTLTVQDIKLVSGEDAASDLSTPWIDQFNTASENSTTLLNTFYDAPYIGLQQPIANLSGFLQDFFERPDEQHRHQRDGADAGQPGGGVDRLTAAERDRQHHGNGARPHARCDVHHAHVQRDSRLLAGQ